DRQVIKLIFKSGYTTLNSAPGEARHGTGMSLVRRYVHEAGGKIALATLLGHETRFKVTLPATTVTDSQVAEESSGATSTNAAPAATLSVKPKARRVTT